jgi:RHS repeat-associated protein
VRQATGSDGVVTANRTVSNNWTGPQSLSSHGVSSTFNWDSALRLSSATGGNGDTTGFSYDAFNRPTSRTNADGTQTAITYSLTAPHRIERTGLRFTQFTYDGLGRTIHASTGYGGVPPGAPFGTPSKPIVIESVVDTLYEPCACTPIGKVKRVSLPRPPGQPVQWTVSNYDELGRTTSTVHAAGSGTTSYVYAVETVSGAIRATVRVTDAAGRWKKHVMDGFGNLREVREPKPGSPGVEMTTVYLYNSRDQLKQVTMVRDGFQGGGAAAGQTQTRTFNYNAGGQLISTVFPENGTTTYTYQNGKMYERIDAANRKTRWIYTDGRLTRIERYPVSTGAEDTTQRTTYYYDITPGLLGSNFVVQNTAGRPVAVASGPYREFYSYTPWGALAKKRVEHPYHGTNQNQNAQILEAALTYDAQGRVSQMLYPSGTLYQYDYHADTERQIGLKRWNASTSQWISAATAGYGFRGEMTSMSWGDPNLAPQTTQTWAYNALGQMTSYNYTPGLSPATNVTYNYGATPAAGKLDSMTVGGVTTTYGYDEAGRLLGASTPTWTQGYVYDGFGNLVVKLATGAASSQAGDLRPLFDSRKNNFTGSPLIPTTGYDVEGRLIANTTLNETYGYDAGNKRVLQRGYTLPEGGGYDTARLTFWLGGQRLGTYSWRYLPENQERPSAYWEQVRTLEDIYIGGKRVEPSDRLGSNIIGRTLLPYGEELTPTPHGGTKFATYQRDSVGQDYADQRYYSVGWGRFYTADPYLASGGAAEPASWNRFAYVEGDPMNHTDHTGLAIDCRWINGTLSCTVTVDTRSGGGAESRSGPARQTGTDYSNDSTFRRNFFTAVREGLAYGVTNLGYSDCDALVDFGRYAMDLAQGHGLDEFVNAFGFLTPSDSMRGLNTVAGAVGIRSAHGDTRLNRTSQPSGFAAQFRDELPGADQAHHFALFFQLGYRGGALEGAVIARVWEVINGTPGNSGDIRLGETAAVIGNALRLHKNPSMANMQIQELCDRSR